MNVDDLPPRTTPYFSKYQRDVFLRGQTEGVFPSFSTDPDELEKEAEKALSRGGWYYLSCNAGQSLTHKANREAFYKWRIVPRMLVDTNQRDISTEFFGHKIDAPIGFSPIGVNKIYHPRGELNAAAVAGELNLPYALSTAGSQPIPDVGAVNGQGNCRIFQLYMPHDDELTVSLLQQAVDAGFGSCVLTVDTWQLGLRHGDLHRANYSPYAGFVSDLGFANPVFKQRLEKLGFEIGSPEAGQHWIDQVWHGKAWTWDKLPWLIKTWKELSGGKPFGLKGIQSVADAERAVSFDGLDFIWVSNHAGRQVDGAIASLDALDQINQAVGHKTTLVFDSGVRSAADVFKAIALGAKVVFVGREYIYGMSIAGEAGVRHVMKTLLAEFDILMNVAGFRSISEITKEALQYVK